MLFFYSQKQMRRGQHIRETVHYLYGAVKFVFVFLSMWISQDVNFIRQYEAAAAIKCCMLHAVYLFIGVPWLPEVLFIDNELFHYMYYTMPFLVYCHGVHVSKIVQLEIIITNFFLLWIFIHISAKSILTLLILVFFCIIKISCVRSPSRFKKP